MALLSIKNLCVDFKTSAGIFRAVDNFNLTINPQDIMAIVGESGSGKSVAMLALMGLLPWTGTITADEIIFDNINLLNISSKERKKIIGKDISMIFQEPMTSLNPCFTVGFQIKETLKTHLPELNRHQIHQRSIELLDQVGIPDSEKRLKAFPHQLSGGMNQRVMIAMAIACNPKVLIADEPTTALDVTIQAQILDLMLELQKDKKMALILITHDMGVVAETAHTVSVQYAGQKIEERLVSDIFNNPYHPYTAALLNALPEKSRDKKMNTIEGVVPGQFDRPEGCLFSNRCPYVQNICKQQIPEVKTTLGQVRCHFPLS
jgi:dipeptide transport system ATP-binding protein